METNCPFCADPIRDHIFLETDLAFAAYNIAPILPGHSMVIPLRHIESIHEFNDAELAGFFSFSRQVTRLLTRAFEAEGFDWSLQESKAAGQSVAHLHLHIIPRKASDLKKPGDWFQKLEEQRNLSIDNPKRKHLGLEEIRKVVNFLRQHAD